MNEPTKLTLSQAGARLHDLHRAHAAMTGEHAGHFWHDCDTFAVARLRGVGHTVYVVVEPEHHTYHLIDWWGEGPSGGLGADWYASDPTTSWGDAVLGALRLLLADPEFAETITGVTALGLAARALAEADAVAARYTP